MQNSKIIGIQPTAFKPKDSETTITGKTLYLTEAMSPQQGQGERSEHIFLSSAKMDKLDFVPVVGNVVVTHYNRWGKVETLQLVDETLDLGGHR